MSSWPECVLDEVEIALGLKLPDYRLMRRTLRPQDPQKSISLRVSNWSPVQGSVEIPSVEPSLNAYNYVIELLVKHADEVKGREMYAEAAKVVRAVLWRDEDLLLRLKSLNEDLLGTKERFMKLRVTSQEYLGSEVNSAWYFVAVTQFQVETSTTPI